MKVLKVLGTEKCYLMDTGEKVPFADIKEYVKNRKQAVIDKPKKRKYTRKKKD
jgi:hypothetical protein